MSVKEILENTETAKQKREEHMASYNQAMTSYLQEAQANGNAIWQAPKESLAKVHAPVQFYTKADGSLGQTYLPLGDTIVALQAQKEKGSADFRWVSQRDAMNHPDIMVKKGAKCVEFVLFTKEKLPYTAKFFNMNDLSGKAIPKNIEISKEQHSRDLYARDMVSYLSMRESRNTLKMDNFALMVKDAREAANNNLQARQEWGKEQASMREDQKQEFIKRLDAVKHMDTSKAATPAEKFQVFLADAYKEEPKHYVSLAVKRAMKELRFTAENVKAAITQYAPGAAYDGPNRPTYAERVMQSINKEQSKAAQR